MVCPNCRTNNVPDAQFCSVCGTVLPMQQAPQMAPPPPTYQAPPYQPPVQQPVVQQPVYQQPVPQVPYQVPVYGDMYEYEKEKMNWAAITGMICGIVSIFACMVSIYLGLLLGIGGVVFGGLGLKSNKRPLAIAGLVCGIVSLVMFVLLLIIGVSVLDYLYYY